MTYTAKEQSTAGGNPIFLYTFTQGATVLARLTSAPEDYTTSGSPALTFTSSEIAHSTIRTTQNPNQDELEITLARSSSLTATLLAPTDTAVTVTIQRVHVDDGEIVGALKFFVGTGRRTSSSVTFQCRTQNEKLRRGALHYRIERTCRHVLYGDGCGLTQGDFEQAAVVTAISGKTVTLQATPDTGSPADTSYFLGGIIRFGTVAQTIDSQSGTTLTLVAAFPDLATEVAANGNTAVALAPGCPLNIATCNARFDNALNFGGFHELPTTGAFDGKSIA